MRYDYKAMAVITNREALRAEYERAQKLEAENTEARRKNYADHIARLLGEIKEPADPEAEKAIDEAIARHKRTENGGKEQHRVMEWPIRVGEFYRCRNGENVLVHDNGKTRAYRYPQDGQGNPIHNYDVNTGRSLDRVVEAWDIFGPANPDLGGIDPPEGYLFTGEFRAPRETDKAWILKESGTEHNWKEAMTSPRLTTPYDDNDPDNWRYILVEDK